MMDMPKDLPKHVNRERTRHGKIVYCFRRYPGKRIRLPDIDHPDFDEAYGRALADQSINDAKPRATAHPEGSLTWLIERYKESAAWQVSIGSATRKQRDNIFKDVIRRSGDPNYTDIDTQAIERGVESRSGTPAQANCFLKAMRGLFKWAVKGGYVETNPASGVDPIRYKSSGFPAWAVEDAEKFRARWPIGTMERLAMELLLHTGLRRSDVVRAGRQNLKGTEFSMLTQKTNTWIVTEFTDYLLHVIGETDTPGMLFLSNSKGGPFSAETFGNWFRDACREADLNKSAHGIRKLAATLSANGGSTTHQLMAQFGWASVKEAETYTKGADRAALGKTAAAKLQAQMRNEFPPHPNSSAPHPKKKAGKSGG